MYTFHGLFVHVYIHLAWGDILGAHGAHVVWALGLWLSEDES